MTDEREERIRRRAHSLWEEEGRPEGRHDDHWRRASEEIEREDSEAAGAAPKRRARKAAEDSSQASTKASTRRSKTAGPADGSAETAVPARTRKAKLEVAAAAPRRGRKAEAAPPTGEAPKRSRKAVTSGEVGTSAPTASRRRRANAASEGASGTDDGASAT